MTLNQFKPGLRVYVEVPQLSGTKYKAAGAVGNAWQAGGPKPIVQFDNGGYVYITEQTAQHFHLEPSN
jgi:hypothetical protein